MCCITRAYSVASEFLQTGSRQKLFQAKADQRDSGGANMWPALIAVEKGGQTLPRGNRFGLATLCVWASFAISCGGPDSGGRHAQLGRQNEDKKNPQPL